MRVEKVMAAWKPIPEADAGEQSLPADPASTSDPGQRLAIPADVPEADVLDQAMPAAPEPVVGAPSMGSMSRPVPEADALEQAMPADHQLYEEDER